MWQPFSIKRGLVNELVDVDEREESRHLRRRWTIVLIGAFWLFAIAMLTLRGFLVDDVPFKVFWWRRLATAILGAALCFGMAHLLDRSGRPLMRVTLGLIGALLMSIIVTLFGLTMNRIIFPVPNADPISFPETAQWVLVWYGYFLAWTGTQLAMTYHWAARDEQIRATEMDSARQRAEISALRYQLNPHFLFNALNSLSCLVMEGRKEVAEQALVNMADFVRAALTSAPDGMVPLAEEVRLQQIYLEVEQTRFGDRLSFDIDVPSPVRRVQVPALILQPLVENAIRHGVSQTEDPVRVRISAADVGGAVKISVCDDARSTEPPRKADSARSGVGLANVFQRLKLQYGGGATLDTRRIAEGGFEAVITIPAMTHD